MNATLLKLWERLQSSFWFLPSLMALGSGLLAIALVMLDEAWGNAWLATQPWARGWMYGGDADGASDVLGIIAGSMIAIAGVVFSMTLVALSLASSQFGPRLLRNFMRDRVNQAVLGTFIATFLYSLLVLRSIRHVGDAAFVPHIAVSVSVMFALLSLGVFIYFIHHVAVSIQGNEIVARVASELMDCIDSLAVDERSSSDSRGHGGREACAAGQAGSDGEPGQILCHTDGYLQIIDSDTLLALAVRTDTVLEVVCRAGHYAIRDTPIVRVWPSDAVDSALEREVREAFAFGNQRTSAQDMEFPLDQLVEVAVRALSPGINDPFTAINCVDRLGSALARLAAIELASPDRCDESGVRRVLIPAFRFPAMLDAACNPIRQCAQSSAPVSIRLLEVLQVIAAAASTEKNRRAVGRQARMIAHGVCDGLLEENDRSAVEERLQAVLGAVA
ncbi:DUF2254 domain-containing protein [Chromatocurvus halotolerans]|nr:DUF2254 domain-containing protein [Chromatocurvus halotolerans]